MASTVFITGASSGIGHATALLFQKKGWQVVATMRSPEKETELSALPNVVCVPLDVTDEMSIISTVKSGIEKFGRIDVLVNNAGYGAVGAFELATGEQVKKQFEVNVFGLMNVTRALLSHFRKNKSGTIINIASVGGRVTFPLYSIYHATKWAVEGFTESLGFELKQFGVRVKIIEPGAIKTDFYSRSQAIFKQEGILEYDTFQNRMLAVSNSFGAGGAEPGVVAQAIYKAATDGTKKLRYPVGGNAPALLILRKIMPDTVFNYFIRKVFGP